jgi:ATP-dependent helicase HrpA
VTRLGRQIAAVPVDPRLGRMLLAASRLGCLAEMLIIAAFLEAQDPRERPADRQSQADQKHALFCDPRSDFLTVLNLWRAFGEQADALSGNQLRRWCREHLLSFLRMREWQDLHAQLAQSVRELDLRPNQLPAAYAELHQAILTGFLGSIGMLDERREYEGPRGMRFVIAPGTPLAAKPPKWVVAGSLIETTRLYARMVAVVDPVWIERAARHLLKHSYSEPHWVQRRGFVGALESVSLFGLTLASRRRIDYGRVAPKEAREIFIREVLIDPGQGPPREAVSGAFLEANRELRGQVERLEAKLRRRDILASEQRQIEFYAARIPERVSSIAAFERWRAQAERREPKVLHMSRTDLMLREAAEVDESRFPEELEVGANRLALRYRFEPGEPDDGITLIVPDLLLETLDADRLEWLVPGWRLEKIIAVMRQLPKSERKRLVPVPEHARQALEELAAVGERALPGFYAGLAHWVSRRTGTPVSAAELAALPLPDHLRMNIRLVDAHDEVVAEGRDVTALRRKMRPRAAALAATGPLPAADSLHRQWDFGELSETRQVQRNGLRLMVFPTLEERRGGVALIEARDPASANTLLRNGVTRLALLALPQQVKYWQERVGEDRELVLAGGGLKLAQPLAQAVTQRIFHDCFAPPETPLPRNRETFNERLRQGRARLEEEGGRVTNTAKAVFKEWRAVRAALDTARSASLAAVLADVNAQLASLLRPDFIESTPRPWFGYLPRYLKALARRLARLPADAKRDAQLAARIQPFVRLWQSLEADRLGAGARPQLDLLRWMIEELRVSFYAQDLRTAIAVSERRLTAQAERAGAEAKTR